MPWLQEADSLGQLKIRVARKPALGRKKSLWVRGKAAGAGRITGPVHGEPAVSHRHSQLVWPPHFDLVGMVLFENISARDAGFRVVVRRQFFDVHAVFVAFDFLLQHIDAQVVPPAQFAIRFVRKNFHELCARRVTAHLVAQFKGQHVAHERLVGIRGVQDPIGFLRKTQERRLQRVIRIVAGLQMKGMFWVAERGVAAHVDQATAVEVRWPGERGAAIDWLDESRRNRDLAPMRNVLAEGIQNHERQVRVETPKAWLKQRVSL